jgi:hypothetical protein
MSKNIATLNEINSELENIIGNTKNIDDKNLNAVINLIILENKKHIQKLIVGDTKNLKLFLKDILTNNFTHYPKFKDKLNLYTLLSSQTN